MENRLNRIKELVEILNEAGKSYYSKGVEIMTNFEYDKLYDELVLLEKETGHVLSNSPTIHVGFEVLSELPKERHESPMLSLDKTKELEVLADWLGSQKGVLSWKLDGLTIVLTYENGNLSKAVTRGNGEVGEIITNNAKVFKNIPLTIPYTGKLIVRGEAIITYSDFEKINANIPEVDAKYKNPRNLCSGSVRQLNNKITAERNVKFFAFSLVTAAGEDFNNSKMQQFQWLTNLGFDVVEHKEVDQANLKETVLWFEEKVKTNDFPSDGLVIIYEDIAYGDSLGQTSKFPKNSLAYKWTDETADTVLREIEWSASRTGLINPIAIFDTVELEGTNVSRASVHNISIMESLQLGIGDTISVFKANMIIPQIAENKTKSGNCEIPKNCPVCGGLTSVEQQNGVKSLYCINPDCQAKHIKSFAHFVSRDAMNIDGLSEATIEKFVQHGFLKDYVSLYHLEEYKKDIVELEGFGKRSFDKLIEAIEHSRHTTMPKVIFSLGISNIGLSVAKMIVQWIGSDSEKLLCVTRDELESIDGVGAVIADAFVSYFEDKDKKNVFLRLLDELDIEKEVVNDNPKILDGKIFVITGSLQHFNNRNDLKDLIESLGGKVASSVSKNTTYLINNNNTSQSTKNKTAAKLNVPVITEDEFLTLANVSM